MDDILNHAVQVADPSVGILRNLVDKGTVFGSGM